MTREEIINIVGTKYQDSDYSILERYVNKDEALLSEPGIKEYVDSHKSAFIKLGMRDHRLYQDFRRALRKL